MKKIISKAESGVSLPEILHRQQYGLYLVSCVMGVDESHGPMTRCQARLRVIGAVSSCSIDRQKVSRSTLNNNNQSSAPLRPVHCLQPNASHAMAVLVLGAR
jgi:hypothetical protein